ncbi:sensor histidine kinase [Actinomadura oligospora]|uniref:sensor histidine kinase n=1 Tax=Actinomadura oligospora TaxID=111804 RepID=UPI001475A6B2|nr:histidine kinase [Actinomadura oligospora]
MTWSFPPRIRLPLSDVGFAAAVTIAGGGLGLGPSPLSPGRGVPLPAVIVAGLAGLSLAFRRRFPFSVALACSVAAVLASPLALPFSLYALALYGRRRTLPGWAAVGAVLLVAAGVHLYYARTAWGGDPTWAEMAGVVASGIVAVVVVPILLGLHQRSRRRLIEALAERAERAEIEQELRADQARLEERARLAGEMHDVVTHRVSLMVLQATSLRTRAPDQEVRAAAEDIRVVGRQAMRELRELVGVLRSQDQVGTVLDDKADVLDVSDLVADSRSAGIGVELATHGEPLPAEPAVRRTAYRIVQEGLTNVHKHAPEADVRVQVRYDAGWIHIAVRNTASSGGPDVELGEGGTGLEGLRQRVDLVGGRLHASPHPDGGFELKAALPVDGRP